MNSYILTSGDPVTVASNVGTTTAPTSSNDGVDISALPLFRGSQPGFPRTALVLVDAQSGSSITVTDGTLWGFRGSKWYRIGVLGVLGTNAFTISTTTQGHADRVFLSSFTRLAWSGTVSTGAINVSILPESYL